MRTHIPDLLSSVQAFFRRPSWIVVANMLDKHERKISANRIGAPRLMDLLTEQDGLTNTEISERLALQPASVTAMIKRLTQFELIEARPDKYDKRQMRVFLSDKGQRHFKEMEQFFDEYIHTMLAGLTDDEIDEFSRLSTIIREHADESRTEALLKKYDGKIMGIDRLYEDYKKLKG
ncbi:MarR family transcriptional regulator [Weissella soli]|uniref:MarR family winged helix-turn-helix transcriptional regulator n=1 Tax=Weissella soli TaxID=155866 RepID=UPI0021C06A98|nr:MarR family transcriptional regulator [Weissella soli]MCT8395317.1 MarR family transcriptional regulator [Weissella soli]